MGLWDSAVSTNSPASGCHLGLGCRLTNPATWTREVLNPPVGLPDPYTSLGNS